MSPLVHSGVEVTTLRYHPSSLGGLLSYTLESSDPVRDTVCSFLASFATQNVPLHAITRVKQKMLAQQIPCADSKYRQLKSQGQYYCSAMFELQVHSQAIYSPLMSESVINIIIVAVSRRADELQVLGAGGRLLSSISKGDAVLLLQRPHVDHKVCLESGTQLSTNYEPKKAHYTH